VLCAAILLGASRAWASTVVEPIARLNLEGGYDSNALYDGAGGDRTGRISPDLGLRLRDHRWDLRTVYGGDWIVYDRLASRGSWNHRALLALDARATRRLRLEGLFRGAYASDPVGLAQMGVLRTGRDSAFVLSGRARGEYRATERVDVAGTLTERTVIFEDRTGGASHSPGVEALYRADRRLSLGAAYTPSLFVEYDPDSTELTQSHALKARARYRMSRRITAEASAGPALWSGRGDHALVPEASIELLGASRRWDMRVQLAHGLGIGPTARPGLVDWLEVAARRVFARRFELRGDGGLWHSGRAPGGEDAVTGYAAAAEAALLVGGGVRLALAATHFARIDDPSAELRRTTVGLRLGWELPLR
jgi:hypothetical protein